MLLESNKTTWNLNLLPIIRREPLISPLLQSHIHVTHLIMDIFKSLENRARRRFVLLQYFTVTLDTT